MYVKKLKSLQGEPKPVLAEGAFSRVRSRLVPLEVGRRPDEGF